MTRDCEICGRTDDAPHHDLVLSTAPWVELHMHLSCARQVTGCLACAAQVDSPDGATGEALRGQILAHHATAQTRS